MTNLADSVLPAPLSPLRPSFNKGRAAREGGSWSARAVRGAGRGAGRCGMAHARDDDALVPAKAAEGLQRGRGGGKDVRRQLAQAAAVRVAMQYFGRVLAGQSLVRVERDEDVSHKRL